ncbi:GGDEF domain-containing protein [Allostreptomyces psammosilenae]|uniref:Diguanylate cyclase (GGDEF)-like protein n=1 Tax=Allostreptomyces psammosilenae TaxID=1892865 RepID=A0A852ZT14_9ACTN|nr:GGDEF domain-containing protein [Allostreptomyces psammosilenae]NYI05566.1 diguanylate cyclase (GGDEF)-like protein [Allostreptomyces psammosilenae]
MPEGWGPLLAAALPLTGWTAHGVMLHRRLAAARRDPLTGLHTRDGWTRRAERVITDQRALVLLVDLNDFKAVNDAHGHAAGDAVLIRAAERLAAWCGKAGVVGRLGGDEFAVAFIDHHGNAADRVNELRAALAEPVPYEGAALATSATVGACRVADLPVACLTDALKAADTAMYAAKPAGGRRAPRRPH